MKIKIINFINRVYIWLLWFCLRGLLDMGSKILEDSFKEVEKAIDEELSNQAKNKNEVNINSAD